ncbi:MAG TPA: type IV pilin N-terminal domain-containing protein [Methanocorpusculum sp.]|nr:type IV pilin N-terminal domain-containing protein [Methanocorpusculum sp.]HJJ53609.1 type IV pilin N-terminal domain-containing protein [Methanocorpusculum sp.]
MKDSAVSPVIGVILMLSVTLLIAGLLSGYVSGFIGSNSVTPSVELTAYTTGFGEDFQFVFEHRGGNILRPVDYKVTTRIIGTSAEANNKFMLSALSTDVWTTGTRITTTNLTHTAEILGVDTDMLNISINKSRAINVAIYHIPSSTQIFEKTILLVES